MPTCRCEKRLLDANRHCHYIRNTSNLPATWGHMTSLKTETMSMRVSPLFKAALKQAAALERRSQANLLELLLFEYCERMGVSVQRSGHKPHTKNTR